MAGRSIEDMSIAFIGAGNLATNLAKALYRKGFRIVQVYSRTKESAQGLAQTVEAAYTTELQAVTKEAQLYIVSLKDAAFVELLPQIVSGKENALWVHTAGSIPMNIWQGHVARYGVLYPMQTFIKQREVDFGQIPCFVESNSEEDVQLLKDIASALSEKVRSNFPSSSSKGRYPLTAIAWRCPWLRRLALFSLVSTLLRYSMTVWLPSAIWAAIQFWQFIESLYASISSGVFPPFSMA